jgi:hypothetical protein
MAKAQHISIVLLVLCACTGHIGDGSQPQRNEARVPDAGTNEAGERAEPSAGNSGRHANAGMGAATAVGAQAGKSAAGSGGVSGKPARAGAGGTSAGVAGSDEAGQGGTSAPSTTPERLYGVTVDSVDALDDTVTSLQMLARRPTTRIVFDAAGSATRYARAAAARGPVRAVPFYAG